MTVFCAVGSPLSVCILLKVHPTISIPLTFFNAKMGAIPLYTGTASQRYFDVHHSGKDVFETVNPRELELGAIAMALFAYILSEEGV